MGMSSVIYWLESRDVEKSRIHKQLVPLKKNYQAEDIICALLKRTLEVLMGLDILRFPFCMLY